ncbi:pathogenesis-related protein 1, partial [Tanacetum coccineum]
MGRNPRRDSPYVMGFPIGSSIWALEARIDVAMAYSSWAWVQVLFVGRVRDPRLDYTSSHTMQLDGVGPMVWDERVASFAQNYANQRQADCQLVHSQNRPYGELIALGTALTGASAVNLWVGEKADYDYNSNTCAPGKTCGHYTQVVWRQSVQLGCARVQCNSGAWFVTCNYDPP